MVHISSLSSKVFHLLLCWTLAERHAHISRCQATQVKRDERESRTHLLLAEGPGCFLQHLPSSFVNSWYNCNCVRASLRRRVVLGWHGCTMQPPGSQRHKCKSISVGVSGWLIFELLACPDATCFNLSPLDYIVGIHDCYLDGSEFRLSYKVGVAALPYYSSKSKQGQ
jgi:hypothetical protein